MLEIEEIKKACEFAEGYRTSRIKTCNIMTISTPFTDLRRIDYWVNENSGDYSLLLQRVIEGINYSESYYCITLDQSGLRVWNDNKKRGDNFYLWCHDSLDQAKEQAIKHILERL